MALEISLFGSCRVCVNGNLIRSFRSNRVQALLIYLVVEPANVVHQRDKLLGILWPGLPQQSAYNNLRQTLYQLRKLIPASDSEAIVTSDRKTIRLNSNFPVTCDVVRFQHLIEQSLPGKVAAVDLYRGSFLDDFYLPDAIAFEEWVARHRALYHDLLMGGCEELAECYLAKNDWETAIKYAKRQLEFDNLRETSQRQLMTALYGQGQRNEALARFEHFRELLERELGVSPSVETIALRDMIAADLRTPEKVAQNSPPIVYQKAPKFEHATIAANTYDSLSDPGLGARSLNDGRQNLPSRLSPFFGREGELAQLRNLLQDDVSRLITIVGPGGIGKTQLALEFTKLLLDSDDSSSRDYFSDGIIFIDLASVETVSEVPQLLGKSLGQEPLIGEPELQTDLIIKYLVDKKMLLFFDNFEHLLPAATLIDQILAGSSAIKILVTSRERLRLNSEQLFVLDGLGVPRQPSGEVLSESASEQLFMYYAKRIAPTYDVIAPAEKESLAQICMLVAGMPLALMLAAGWVDVLSLEDIVKELEQGVRLLATEIRNLPEKHQSMQTVIDSSWSRLQPVDRSCLAAMSTFRDGFSREAAKQVCEANIATLSRLVAKSLLHFEREKNRYYLHPLLQQYCAKKLNVMMASEKVAGLHSSYFLNLVSRLDKDILGPQQLKAIAKLSADLGNIELAVMRAASPPYIEELGKALDGLWHYYNAMQQWGQFAELREQLFDLFSQQGISQSQSIWYRLLIRDPHPRNIEQLLEALNWAMAQNDRVELALCHVILGEAYYWTGEPANAYSQVELGLSIYAELGDEFHYALALQLMGFVHVELGELDQAFRVLEISSQNLMEAGDQLYYLRSLLERASICWQLGRYERADRFDKEFIHLSQQRGMLSRAALVEMGLMHTAILQGEFERAAELFQNTIGVLERQVHVVFNYLDRQALLANLSGDYVQALTLFERGLQQVQAIFPRLDSKRAFNYRWGLAIAHYGLANSTRSAQQLCLGIGRSLTLNETGNVCLFLPVAALHYVEAFHYERATKALAAASAQLGDWGAWLHKWELFMTLRATIEEKLGESRFARLWQEGSQLDVIQEAEQAIQFLNMLVE